MLTSITPLGERGRHARWGVTVAWYVVGSALAAAAFGAAAGLVGQLALAMLHGAGLRPAAGTALAVLAAAAAAGCGADLLLRGRPLPGPRRQVDEDWLARYRGWVYGGGFGVQLGVGVATIVTSASVYVTWAAALLTASPAAGALVGLAFGLARALPVLGLRRTRSAVSLAVMHRRLAVAEPLARRTAIVALGVIAVLGALAALSQLGALTHFGVTAGGT